MQSAQAIPTLGKIDSSGFDHQRSGLSTQAPLTLIVQALTTRGQNLEDKPHPPVVVHLFTTSGQQLKAQTVTQANQIKALTNNPNIPLQL